VSFSLHFLNEMVPMRIFRSRHAADIVDIQTDECIPAIWQEFVKGGAFLESVVMFDTASTRRSRTYSELGTIALWGSEQSSVY
jgi:hypothetical protein